MLANVLTRAVVGMDGPLIEVEVDIAQSGLPNFLIVGAPKCGTTSMANWLRAHPDVWIPPEKIRP